MYVLKIYNEYNNFGFLERDEEILNDDEYRITEEEYLGFFKEQEQGKQYRLKLNIDYNNARNLKDFIEEFTPNQEDKPISPIDVLEKENLKIKLALAEIVEGGI